MISAADIEKLLVGRSLVDSYRVVKCSESIDRDMTVILKSSLEQSLLTIGFQSLEEFFFFDGRLSLLELVRCYRTVHAVTGEDNPLCDLCEDREPRGCYLSNLTGEIDQERIYCSNSRAAGSPSTRLPFITEDEDLVLVRQKARALDEGKYALILFSISDAVFFWNFNENHVAHTKCVAKALQVESHQFDPFWNLSKYHLRG
jgi:hypothetical protein